MLKKIRLELARDHDFPEGSRNYGYEFAVPLDASGHIDAAEWAKRRDHCRVRRFRPGEPDDVGHVVRRPGGSWAFHYDIVNDDEDDESGYRFANHAFVPGEYVSVKEEGELRTFRVARVADV